MRYKHKIAYIVVSDEPPKAFKSLRSLCYNIPNLKYFSLFRQFKTFNAVITDNITIYKSTIQ